MSALRRFTVQTLVCLLYFSRDKVIRNVHNPNNKLILQVPKMACLRGAICQALYFYLNVSFNDYLHVVFKLVLLIFK